MTVQKLAQDRLISDFLCVIVHKYLRNPMKNYRVRVETNDGCVTIWYEKSSAKKAPTLICNRVHSQLCGLNVKEISVDLSV